MHVGDHHVEAGLHEAEGSRREHQALVVEAAHQHPRAFADPAEHVLRRDLAVVEEELAGVRSPHPELVELPRGGEPGESLLDDERGEPPGTRVGVRAGVDHEGVGVRPVRDPHLAAVEEEAVTLAFGPRPHAHHVRARPRLAHREGADVLAPDEGWKVAALLFLAPVAADLVDAQVRVRAVAQAHRRRRAAHLLHRDAVLGIAEPDPAVLLLDGDPEDAEIAHLRPEVGGEVVRLVDRRRPGRDLVRGEAHHAVPDEVGLVAEAEVEAGSLVRAGYGAHRSSCASGTGPKYAPTRRRSYPVSRVHPPAAARGGASRARRPRPTGRMPSARPSLRRVRRWLPVYLAAYTGDMAQVTVHLPDDVLAAARKCAGEERRSLSAWAGALIQEATATEWPESLIALLHHGSGEVAEPDDPPPGDPEIFHRCGCSIPVSA